MKVLDIESGMMLLLLLVYLLVLIRTERVCLNI